MNKMIAAGLTLALLAFAETGIGNAEPTSGCWGCTIVYEGGQYHLGCGVQSPGFWNCSGWCNLSSAGCGGQVLIPVDADGTMQYAVLEVGGSRERIVRRPCDGILVARTMTEAVAAEMLGSTSTITI